MYVYVYVYVFCVCVCQMDYILTRHHYMLDMKAMQVSAIMFVKINYQINVHLKFISKACTTTLVHGLLQHCIVYSVDITNTDYSKDITRGLEHLLKLTLGPTEFMYLAGKL